MWDDAAVLDTDCPLVVTQDTIVEGVHVREHEDLADIAWKLVAVNLSDLAAKGASPVGVTISHMLGRDDERFLAGLQEVLETFDVPLIGGDTVSGTGRRVWNCTAIGKATHTPVPDRRGAGPGDAVYVTGTLGRAMLGFEGDETHAEAYTRPKPLLGEGKALAPFVTAMMDVSDGLLLDCWRLARASNCTIQLDSESFPVAEPTRLNRCVRWGDDYQLLFTAPPDAPIPVPATRIGHVDELDIARLRVDSEILTPEDGLGYNHD